MKLYIIVPSTASNDKSRAVMPDLRCLLVVLKNGFKCKYIFNQFRFNYVQTNYTTSHSRINMSNVSRNGQSE